MPFLRAFYLLLLYHTHTFPLPSYFPLPSLATALPFPSLFPSPVNMVLQISSTQEFDSTIAQGIVVVDFYATWCGPCRVIAPKVDQLSTQFTSAKFIKVDVDELTDVAQKCKIRAMPTFHVYKDGKVVEEIVGADIKALTSAVEKVCA